MPKRVLEKFVRVAKVLHLHVRDRVIGTTAEHPMYAYGRGWIPAHELRVGDWFSTDDGRWVELEDICDSGEVKTVYNLEVEDYHTYFVGCEAWGFALWAHNGWLKQFYKAGKGLAKLGKKTVRTLEDLAAAQKAGKARQASKRTATRLAQQGEDLFVGTYSQSRRGNLQSGLNATHTPHHSVQNAVSSTSHGTGVTINLRKDLHAMTRTYRKPVERGLTLRQHLGRDVADIKRLLTNAGYDRRTINTQLQELIRQNKAVGGFGK